ncbi:MAG TPA: PEGA domain-containing protein [Polyangiaceae bacterium]|nr:PEGA domain-containing protein [Polyangiaceae bacterium]
MAAETKSMDDEVTAIGVVPELDAVEESPAGTRSEEATVEFPLDANDVSDDDETRKPPLVAHRLASFSQPERPVPAPPPAPPISSSLGPEVTPASLASRPRRDTMVGFPVPPAPGSVPQVPKAPSIPSGPSRPLSLPPAPIPPRSSAVPAPPRSSGVPAPPGSLSVPAPPRSSGIPAPPLPPSAPSAPRLVSLPPSSSGVGRAPVPPPPAPPALAPPPLIPDSAAIYAAPVAPPASHRPQLPVSSGYDDSDEDEVTSVFAPGSEAALRLGERVTPQEVPVRARIPAPIAPVSRPPHSSHPSHGSQPISSPAARLLDTRPPTRAMSAPPMMVKPAINSDPELVLRPQRGMGRWVAAGLGFVAAAGVLFFFFRGPSTGNLVVTVVAPGALPLTALNVFVDGEQRCTMSPCELQGLVAGSHLVRALAHGFENTAEQAVIVQAGKDVAQNFTLTPQAPQKATLQASAKGSVATKVSVDGKPQGALPLSLNDLDPGTHQLRFEAGDNFIAQDKTVSLTAGQTLTLDPIELQIKQGTLRIALPREFARATVSLDKKVLHKFPAQIQLDAQVPHEITAKLRGYDDYSREVRFTADSAEQQIEISFEHGESKAAGHAAAVAAAPAPSPSPKHVALAPFPAPATPKPASEKPTAPASAAVESPSGYGTLNLNSIPSSTVQVNGKTVGRTPRMGLRVKSGKQFVVFIHPDKGRKEATVNVPAGETKTIAVRF